MIRLLFLDDELMSIIKKVAMARPLRILIPGAYYLSQGRGSDQGKLLISQLQGSIKGILLGLSGGFLKPKGRL